MDTSNDVKDPYYTNADELPPVPQYPSAPPPEYVSSNVPGPQSMVPPFAGYTAGQPILAQPQPGPPPVPLMPPPEILTPCPPGLEYLVPLDTIRCSQVIYPNEINASFEAPNRYVLKNSLGQQVYFANEESDEMERNQYLRFRAFLMHIMSNSGQEVIRLVKGNGQCRGCVCCGGTNSCKNMILVESPPGYPLGSIQQKSTPYTPIYRVMDQSDNDVALIEGDPFLIHGAAAPVSAFPIHSPDMSYQIGEITKNWVGDVKEYFARSQEDMFVLKIPLDMDVKMKALLLAGVFLLEFIFFARVKKYQPQRRRR